MEFRSSTQTRAHQGVKWLIFFRLLLAVITIAVILISSIGSGEGVLFGPREKAIYSIVTFICLLNLFYLVLMRWVSNHLVYAFVQITIDIIIESALVYCTGGVESNFIFLFFASILAASMVLSGRMAVFFASEATIMLSAVTIAYYLDHAPFGLGGSHATKMGPLLTFHFAQAVSFFLVALLSSSLARRLSTTRIFNEEILESIGQGIAAFDNEDRVTFANSEIGRILGREVPFAGQDLEDALPLEGESAIRAAVARRDANLFELDLLRPDGTLLPLRIKTVPITAEGGQYRGAIVVVTELTLERRVEEAMTQAERSSAISEMSASIAHEIRNPLASIRGAVQEIQRGTDVPEAKKPLMDIVMSESDRLDNIISDFLDFARMRPVRKVDCDIAAIINETIALIERASPEVDQIAVKADLSGPLPVRADSEQLRQVLLNLGLNSIAAIDGSGNIKISAQLQSRARFGGEAGRSGADEKDEDGVAIEFFDDGSGMDEATRHRAFDPFFTTRTGGTGLGLSVVSRIIRGHGGRLGIVSAPAEGTTVRLWLPER